MKKLWIECVLPESDIRYLIAVDELNRNGPTELTTDTAAPSITAASTPASSSSASSSSSPEAGALNINHRPRTVVTFDGCWQQLNAVMTSLNSEFTVRGYEAFKFAAATTFVEQPNDVGHCHKAIKGYYKNKKYRRREEWNVPQYLEGFDITMESAGLDSGSLDTYWKALCHLETCLSKVCTIPMIEEGFRVSGIYPVDNHAILSGWCGWSLCSKVKAEEIISLLPTLTEIVKINGRVTDDEIEACMGHIIDFDPNTRKSNSCALNHGRCV